MNISQIISETKAFILKGDVSKALSQLYTFLEKEDKYNELANTALQLKGKLSKLQQDKAREIISFDNAQLANSKIVNSLTLLLGKLESGEFTMDSTPTPSPQGKKWWIPVVVILLLGGSFFGYKKVFKKKLRPQEATITIQNTACPAFDKTSDFNILILPFINFGAKVPSFDEAIRQGLENNQAQLNFDIDTEIYTPKEKEKVNPANGKEAERYTGKCKDEVKLVLWGSYEKQASKTLVTTRYKFLNIKDDLFSFDQLNIAGDFKPVSVSSISSIAAEGSATGDIQALLLGIAANQMGDKEAAIAFLEKLEPSDSATSLLWGMTLADSYLANGFNKKALESYDKVLELHPDYRFALMNRSVLNYQNGNTEAAIQDLNHQLKKSPNDKDALYSRAVVYVQVNQLDKAEKDISKLKVNGTKKKIVPLTKKYEQKVSVEKRRKRKAEDKLRTDPNNIQALNILSESNLHLGDYRAALIAAKKSTRAKPKNEKAWAIQLQAMKELNMDKRTIQQSIQKANAAGISNTQLKKASPYIYYNLKIQE